MTSSGDYKGSSRYWLRSPDATDATTADCVNYDPTSTVYEEMAVTNVTSGVRPTLVIQL